MSDIKNLPNFGPVLAQRLKNAGITSLETLIKPGSKEAFVHICMHEPDACLCSLYALQGAIQGIR